MATPRKADAVVLLKQDHRKVEELFANFQTARGPERKKKIAMEICKELTIHTDIEERIFYPACRGGVEDDLLDESQVEHDSAKVLIGEILAGEPDDAFYDAKVTVLSEMIKHHVKEEEAPGAGLFGQARKAGIDLLDLGQQIMEEKKTLEAGYSMDAPPIPAPRSFTSPALA